MLELALAWVGGLLMGAAVVLGVAYRPMRRWLQRRLTFEDVCQAAARAKQSRRTDQPEEHLEREYIDGVDAVMAELMKDGYGDGPGELRAAYLAGGEEVEIDV